MVSGAPEHFMPKSVKIVTMKIKHITLLLLVISLLIFASPAKAADPVVHAVLIYSPTCGHCHEVMTNVLPPIQEKYGNQLEIVMVNVTTGEGAVVYNSYIDKFSPPSKGVPAMIVGDTYMLGSIQIPEQLEGLIDAGLAAGGIAYPDLEGLPEYIQTQTGFDLADAPSVDPALAEASLQATEPADPQPTTASTPNFIRMFQRDVLGNSIAVLVLLGMIISLIWILVTFLNPPEVQRTRGMRYPWLIPALCAAGLFVAGYMSYVEINQVEAVCGPIGDCNSVQQSPYAMILGFLPVGVFGIMGYVAILAAWLVWRFFTNITVQKWAAIGMWGMAVFGVLFSIYLTYLEPFVIGATCIWCISSALIILALMWVTTPLATELFWAENEPETRTKNASSHNRTATASQRPKAQLTSKSAAAHRRPPKKKR